MDGLAFTRLFESVDFSLGPFPFLRKRDLVRREILYVSNKELEKSRHEFTVKELLWKETVR